MKALMLDLDGTLVDSAPDFVFVLNHLRDEEGLEPLEAQLIRNTVSNGARALITLGFGVRDGEPGFDELRQRLLDLYATHLAVHSDLFTGMKGLLGALEQQRIPWGIATNKPERYTTPLLAKLQLSPACVICPDHVRKPKPDPESLHLAARQLNCAPEDLVYIGDHRRDIECGLATPCITIAAAYGYIDAGEEIDSWGAHHRVEHPDDIWPLLTPMLSI